MITKDEQANDFSTYLPGYKKRFVLLAQILTLPPLVLTAQLLAPSTARAMGKQGWWEFVLISGNLLLCEVRVHDPALALPFLVAVVTDAFPAPPSRHPEERSPAHIACESLREIFRAPA